MKYPNYFEIEVLEELKAFLARDPGKKGPYYSGQKEKTHFKIYFKMTNQFGRVGRCYQCVGFSTDWDDKKIKMLRFRKESANKKKEDVK